MKYTHEILEPIVEKSESIAQVLVALGLSVSGGNHSHIKRRIKLHGISTDHFLGQAINKGKSFPDKRIKPEEYLRNYDITKHVSTSHIRERCLRDGVFNEECMVCGKTEWFGEQIPLELHHIDQDRWNNTKENLLILCPNCHTIEHRIHSRKMKANKKKKSKKRKKVYTCSTCGKQRSRSSKSGLCVLCFSSSRRKTERPPKAVLLKEVVETSYSAVGRKYGVSDNAIRKWIKAV